VVPDDSSRWIPSLRVLWKSEGGAPKVIYEIRYRDGEEAA
jgi:hypothetical protein